MNVPAQKQLRYVFTVTSGATPESGKAEYWDGDINWVTPEDITPLTTYWLKNTRRKITQAGYDASGTKIAPVGSIVLTKRAPIGQVAILAEAACSNQGCFLLTPQGEVDTRFFYYWLSAQSDRLQILGRGSTFMELSTDEVKSLRLPLPHLKYQRAIADYLDHETARIDALIAAKERLLGLLAEKRRALITRAVTRGLDPSVAMKDTGIEWIPNIPTHWKVSRIGRLFRQSKQVCFPDLPILSVYREYGVIERMSRDDNSNRIPDDLEKYQLVQPGDLVINKMKAWQGSLGISEYLGITSPDYVVFRPMHKEESAFLHFFLRMQMLTTVYLSISNGIRINQWRIEPERFVGLPIFLPPRTEQQTIVDYICCETMKLDKLSHTTGRAIVLLKERRAALVAAAVTGQVEVRQQEGPI